MGHRGWRRRRPALAHPTHEFYYILAGRGVTSIGDEEREVRQGDLVYIPPDATHSMWPATRNAPLRGLAFAVGVKGAATVDYSSDGDGTVVRVDLDAEIHSARWRERSVTSVGSGLMGSMGWTTPRFPMI